MFYFTIKSCILCLYVKFLCFYSSFTLMLCVKGDFSMEKVRLNITLKEFKQLSKATLQNQQNPELDFYFDIHWNFNHFGSSS